MLFRSRTTSQLSLRVQRKCGSVGQRKSGSSRSPPKVLCPPQPKRWRRKLPRRFRFGRSLPTRSEPQRKIPVRHPFRKGERNRGVDSRKEVCLARTKRRPQVFLAGLGVVHAGPFAQITLPSNHLSRIRPVTPPACYASGLLRPGLSCLRPVPPLTCCASSLSSVGRPFSTRLLFCLLRAAGILPSRPRRTS